MNNTKEISGNIISLKNISGNIQKAQTIYKDNYNDLTNKPSVNGVVLKGNVTIDDLGIDSENILNLAQVAKTGSYEDLLDKPEIDIDKDYVDNELAKKIDKIIGKGLSSNDFTTTEKEKLASLENYDDTAIKSDIDALQNNKVDKVSGKGLSTNDYTTAEKNKLAGIETGANKTIVDASLSSISENPVQNKIINTALSNKVDKETGKGLSSNDYTTAEKEKLAGL